MNDFAPRKRVRPGTEKSSPRERLRDPAHEQKAAPVTREPAHAKPERTRRRKLMQHDDIFWLPVEEIPDTHKTWMTNGAGNRELVISYEWKRWSNVGQDDPYYFAAMRDQGFEPVDPRRHPNWLPPGFSGPHIIRGGLILMERPIELKLEAISEERALSKRQVKDAEARLGMTPKGELTRNFPGVEPHITKEYVRPVMIRGED